MCMLCMLCHSYIAGWEIIIWYIAITLMLLKERESKEIETKKKWLKEVRLSRASRSLA